MAIEKDKFEIVILDAEKLIRKHEVINTGDAWHVRYKVDYSMPRDRRWYTKSINLLSDNALFFQIRDLYHLQLTGQKKTDRDLLKRYIVYIDFNRIFNSIERIKDELMDPYSTSYVEKDLINTSDRKYDEFKVKEIIDQGIYIHFEGEENFQRFVPFDKSNSMSKKSILSFIREDLKSSLEARLNLNINFNMIDVWLSRYYAYRGLYLTDARRVCDNTISLNCNSVIVIDDVSVSVPVKNQLIGNKDEHKIKKLFDGEGIVSPVYAERIADNLNLCVKKIDDEGKYTEQKATSFQVRLPFAKGMLHSVDFKKFIQRYGNISESGYMVVDAFGYKRNLFDAEIIMSTSMLKCWEWLKEAVKNLEKDETDSLHELERQYKKINGGEIKAELDPMWFYFYQVEKCHHALYIANTNLSYGRGSKIKLGYQFLNTLKLNINDLDIYTDQTKRYIDDPISYLNDIKNNVIEEEAADDEEIDHRIPNAMWERALLMNPYLAYEAKIRRELRNLSYSVMQEYAYGRFLVDGEVRILSRDLLEFLIQLLRLENKANPNISILEDKRMFQDCFFMPYATLTVKPREYYAVLRNPHLSRNEQCALTPFLGEDIYREYFGHLMGIIMVAYNALDPIALGGADFDGDIIKFIHDRKISNAVLEANYEKQEIKKGSVYKRSRRIIEIDGAGGSKKIERERVPDHITYKLIKNTFSNKVGMISNRAIEIGRVQYSAEDHGLKYDGPKCEDCLILTGLEIDAAKTGNHPDLSKLSCIKSIGREYIKDFKKPFDDNFVGSENNKISKTNVVLNGAVYQVVKHKEDKEEKRPNYVIDYPILEEDYLLGKIPEKFFEMVMNFGQSVPKKKNGIFFEFQKDKKWEEKIEPEDKKKVAAIIVAYRRISEMNKSLNRWNKRRNNRKTFAGFTHNTLEWQYDMPAFEEKWLQIDEIMTDLDRTFVDTNSVEEAIRLLKEKKWPFSLPEEKEIIINDVFNQHSYPDELFEIVSNFGTGGYRLLYYILQDLRSMKLEEMQNTEYIEQYVEEFDQEVTYECDKDEYKFFYKKFYAIYYDMIFDENSGIMQSLLEEAVSRVEKLLEGKDTEYQLKLLYSLKGKIDKDSEFFWAYFKPEMLDFVGGAASC